MSVSAYVENGKLVESASQNSISKATGKNAMDKDAFLQLLVAQMKYQDPLEPTSNTEYIAQYATFSQVEQMQNMSQTMELSRASSMVGKIVTVETTTSSGDPKTVEGMVEYVTFENNKAYVSIDGYLYSADDVIAVKDETYQTAQELAVNFLNLMKQLPSLSDLQIGDKELVDGLQKAFNSMTAYQQSFFNDDIINKLQEYVAKMADLVEIAGGKEVTAFINGMDQLPELDKVTIEDKETIEGLQKAYDALTDKQKSYINEDYTKKLEEYVKKIKDLEDV